MFTTDGRALVPSLASALKLVCSVKILVEFMIYGAYVYIYIYVMCVYIYVYVYIYIIFMYIYIIYVYIYIIYVYIYYIYIHIYIYIFVEVHLKMVDPKLSPLVSTRKWPEDLDDTGELLYTYLVAHPT